MLSKTIDGALHLLKGVREACHALTDPENVQGNLGMGLLQIKGQRDVLLLNG